MVVGHLGDKQVIFDNLPEVDLAWKVLMVDIRGLKRGGKFSY